MSDAISKLFWCSAICVYNMWSHIMRFILDRPHKHHRLHKLRIVMPRCFAETPLVPLSFDHDFTRENTGCLEETIWYKGDGEVFTKKSQLLYLFFYQRYWDVRYHNNNNNNSKKCVRFFNRDWRFLQDTYTMQKKALGEGSFGSAFKATCKSSWRNFERDWLSVVLLIVQQFPMWRFDIWYIQSWK